MTNVWRRKKSPLFPVLTSTIAFGLAVAIAVTIYIRPSSARRVAENAKQAVAAVVPAVDENRRIVDHHFRMTLNDPDYEVVQWWPAADAKRAVAEKVKEIDEDMADRKKRITLLKLEMKDNPGGRASSEILTESAHLESSERMRKQYLEDLGKTVCRMRYRAKNPFGAKMLHDSIFLISDGKVSEFKSTDEDRGWGEYIYLFKD